MNPKTIFYSLAVIIIIFSVTVYLYHKPYYNWDQFPYMALAASDASIPFAQTHADVYAQAASQMPPQDFTALTQRQPLLMQSPDAFQGILRYFEIKPSFILLIKTFHWLGFSLITSVYLPSLVSYFFMGCLLWVWMQRLFSTQFATVISLLIAASPFLVITARYSSPDMLCAAVFLAGLFLLSESGVFIGLIFILVSITVRPDTAIPVGLIILALYKCGRLTLMNAMIWGSVGFLIMLIVIGGPGIIKEFFFTYPSSYSSTWNANEMIANYYSALGRGLNSVLNSHTIIFTLLAVATLYMRMRSIANVSKDLWSFLVISALATFIVRYLLHPVVEDRFQITSYLIILIAFCQTFKSAPQNLERVHDSKAGA